MKKTKIEVKRKETGINPKKKFKPKMEYYWIIAIIIFAILIAFALASRCIG